MGSRGARTRSAPIRPDSLRPRSTFPPTVRARASPRVSNRVHPPTTGEVAPCRLRQLPFNQSRQTSSRCASSAAATSSNSSPLLWRSSKPRLAARPRHCLHHYRLPRGRRSRQHAGRHRQARGRPTRDVPVLFHVKQVLRVRRDEPPVTPISSGLSCTSPGMTSCDCWYYTLHGVVFDIFGMASCSSRAPPAFARWASAR
jgi:hypothetical protein